MVQNQHRQQVSTRNRSYHSLPIGHKELIHYKIGRIQPEQFVDIPLQEQELVAGMVAEEGQPVVAVVGMVAVAEQLVAVADIAVVAALPVAVQEYIPAGQVAEVAKRILYVLRMQKS